MWQRMISVSCCNNWAVWSVFNTRKFFESMIPKDQKMILQHWSEVRLYSCHMALRVKHVGRWYQQVAMRTRFKNENNRLGLIVSVHERLWRVSFHHLAPAISKRIWNQWFFPSFLKLYALPQFLLGPLLGTLSTVNIM
jgi:hypothetical protein